ncbi:hypothetical protein QBC42DRAFT_327720 [Cladorrhinum samala]|uniref:Uncharacterized protein n=1 Tax=Cladorrhinum samala TaxID=585594 RepID=A0AAV9I4W7_9PEZI|nr:hypothetical protein QBC42DRAFT_327720 [Cladorrhinum samala]
MPGDKQRDVSEEVMEWDHQQLLVCVLSVLHDPQLRAGLLARVPHMEQFRAQTPGEVGVTPYGVSKLIRLAATTLKESPEKTKGQKLAVDKKSNAPTKPKRCRKESAHDEVREKKQMRRNVDHMPAAAAAKPPQSTSPVPDSAKKPSPDERGERMCKNCGAKFLPGVENQNCCQYHKEELGSTSIGTIMRGGDLTAIEKQVWLCCYRDRDAAGYVQGASHVAATSETTAMALAGA